MRRGSDCLVLVSPLGSQHKASQLALKRCSKRVVLRSHVVVWEAVFQSVWRCHRLKKGGRFTDESVHYSIDRFASVVRC